MEDAAALRAEIAHLRSLAKLITDPQTLVAINELAEELELRLSQQESGGTA
jgi:hypothetical protein